MEKLGWSRQEGRGNIWWFDCIEMVANCTCVGVGQVWSWRNRMTQFSEQSNREILLWERYESTLQYPGGCKLGHIWLYCYLYQASCQALIFKRYWPTPPGNHQHCQAVSNTVRQFPALPGSLEHCQAVTSIAGQSPTPPGRHQHRQSATNIGAETGFGSGVGLCRSFVVRSFSITYTKVQVPQNPTGVSLWEPGS